MIVTSSILKDKYIDYANPIDKIKREVDSGELFRLAKGLYETSKDTTSFLLAPAMLSPSYISFDWALSYYGLIPERVNAITSASLNIRKNKSFTNIFGRYEFSDIPEKVFPEGVTFIEENSYIARIATKEKAICDSLYKWRVVNNLKELKELLFIDKRIDEDVFKECDFNNMIRLASLYHKKNLKLLIKLIQKEYI